MANFIVMELAQEPDEAHTRFQPKPEKWFFTGRSFIATSTGYAVEQLLQSDFFIKNFNRQCDEEFGTWEGVEILPFPDSSNKPTLVKVLDQALPLMP